MTTWRMQRADLMLSLQAGVSNTALCSRHTKILTFLLWFLAYTYDSCFLKIAMSSGSKLCLADCCTHSFLSISTNYYLTLRHMYSENSSVRNGEQSFSKFQLQPSNSSFSVNTLHIPTVLNAKQYHGHKAALLQIFKVIGLAYNTIG